ncbi:uncharacterized protein LOC110435012 [Sorghum bicolor]|uniref:Uncharacterized protein n=1 Tax=Sorghum bicolor TaxID=4558 RepID=A0A194YN93_SORBI|nr:uncharacterized protein LOC110435012 [Sorghum bicolor]KXG29656.1 hypothetical protein SORBI_3004G071600 [Sorghum bicolor]|eukprot:XP_021315938.1 uncharacterized protein LOC110435012 [Sorghum bicolor]
MPCPATDRDDGGGAKRTHVVADCVRASASRSSPAERGGERGQAGRSIAADACLFARRNPVAVERNPRGKPSFHQGRSGWGRKGKTCMRQIPIVGSSRDERQVPLVGGVGPGPGDAQHKHQQPGPSPSLMSMATAVRSPATPLRTTSMEGTCCRCYSVRLLVV